jgi:hypothetical protein
LEKKFILYFRLRKYSTTYFFKKAIAILIKTQKLFYMLTPSGNVDEAQNHFVATIKAAIVPRSVAILNIASTVSTKSL